MNFDVAETPSGHDSAALIESVRAIDERAIKAHADLRFRSEYDYALFEYTGARRSSRLPRTGRVAVRGACSTPGCGGGGMPLSLAGGRSLWWASTRSAASATRACGSPASAASAGCISHWRTVWRCLFRTGHSTWCSHAVIEHVADAPLYCTRVREGPRAGWTVYLSTSPYLLRGSAPAAAEDTGAAACCSAGASFATFTFLARHAAWTLREPANENSFIKLARKGEIKHDDLLELVTVSRLRAQIAAAGLAVVREELHLTATIRRLPDGVGNALKEDGLTRDIFISNMEYVLAHASTSLGPLVPGPASLGDTRAGA